MKIGDALDKATASVRTVKERHVRQVKGKPGHTDIQTVIESYRGDDLVATVFLPPDRDAMLEAAWIAARGFSADVIAVTMETYQGTATTTGDDREAWDRGEIPQMLNPLTGKPLEQGDLTDLALNHDGIARGWVTEALVTQVLNRAGDSKFVTQPYRIVGREVEWTPLPDTLREDMDSEGFDYRGIVPESLADAMRADTIDQVVAKETLLSMGTLSGLGEERARAHADVAAVRVISERLARKHVMVLLAAKPGSVREQVLRDRFPRSQVIRPDGGDR